MQTIMNRLKKSRFRKSFYLTQKDINYIKRKKIETIYQHAEQFIKNKLINAKSDGKQTPFKGHPVFIAQHATATCCRKCVEKWHKIPKSKELSEMDIAHFRNIIMGWIGKQMVNDDS